MMCPWFMLDSGQRIVVSHTPPHTQRVRHQASTVSTCMRAGCVPGSPRCRYVRAIDAELIAPLGRDARVTTDILDEVKTIFLALPADIQARILLTAIQHPTNVNMVQHGAEAAVDLNAEAQAEIVRDVMAAGGVVAVKLGQMLAEDPKVPADYRKVCHFYFFIFLHCWDFFASLCTLLHMHFIFNLVHCI